jgi:type IV pilus assembly protein PilN
MMGISVSLALGIVLGLELLFSFWYAEQQSRNDYLKNQITILNQKIKKIDQIKKKKKAIMSKVRVIQKLQKKRPLVVHIFSLLPSIIGDGVYLKHVAKSGTTMNISGGVKSNRQLSELMRLINKAKWFKKAHLVEIKSPKAKSSLSQFQIRVNVQTAKDP